ncbi:hypothetical protein J4218_04025 [Candidatus Pacearchaeota archaeon]|nr:hypothetical protein [Candidatus Pacearchaeota archaeon]
MKGKEGKGVIDEIDDVERIKKDEAKIEEEVDIGKKEKLREQKRVEDNIETEETVFDYDESF